MLLAPEPRLYFDVPNGRLALCAVDLERWAEHLAWCYGFMGIAHGATIAAQDFGSSPISFLGSALLMPGLDAGIAERMEGRFICLDASGERTTLTPGVLAQLPVDALIVRADILGLLQAEIAKKSRSGIESGLRLIVTIDENDRPVQGRGVWRHLLNVPASMLLAPECPQCGHFHLRNGFYEVTTDGEIRNLRLSGAARCRLEHAEILVPGRCAMGPEDACVAYCEPNRG
jgi:hypothetical protein